MRTITELKKVFQRFEERAGCRTRAFWRLVPLLAVIVAAVPAFADSKCPEGAGATVRGDAAQSFTMVFPADFTVTDDPKLAARQSYFPQVDETMRLAGFYSGQAFAGTNFGSAGIVVSVSPAREEESDCARFEGDLMCGAEEGVRDTVVNGIQFKSATLSDAAVGHRLEVREYWTVRHGQRYEIRLSVSYTDIGMYTPGEKREFSPADCWAKLTAVLNTFSFR